MVLLAATFGNRRRSALERFAIAALTALGHIEVTEGSFLIRIVHTY